MKPARILSWPALVWYIFFLSIPILLVVILSLQERGTYGDVRWTWSGAGYAEIFSSSVPTILGRSLVLAFFTTALTVTLSVLLCWKILTFKPAARIWFLAPLVLPFIMNLIIRIYALRNFLSFDGPVQGFTRFLNLDWDLYGMNDSVGLVYFGMVTTYLPFAVLPIYAAMEKFDFAIFEAGMDLGASASETFFSLVIPNIRPALVAATVLVFIPALGEFVIPDLLGGAKTFYLGSFLTEEFLKVRNWPAGSALAVSVLVGFALLIGAYKISRRISW